MRLTLEILGTRISFALSAARADDASEEVEYLDVTSPTLGFASTADIERPYWSDEETETRRQ